MRVRDYQVFPRLLALAERAWHQADWEIPYDHDGRSYSEADRPNYTDQLERRREDWRRFSARVGLKEFPKLSLAGVAYRVPPPGAKIQGGHLYMNRKRPVLLPCGGHLE